MKIAFIGQKGIPAKTGGIEAHVQALSEKLVPLGFHVTVYTRSHYAQAGNVQGIEVKEVTSIHTKHLDTITHVFFALIDAMKHKHDVIHFHGIGPAILMWIPIVFSPKTKILFTFHCKDYEHKKWGWFARKMLKFGEWMGNTFADKIIVVSKTLQVYVKETYKRGALYIPNGVTVQTTQPANEITKKWGLQGNDYILSVSRLVAHKGIHYLVKAFKQLKTDKKLVIVGDGSFTDTYVEELKTLAANDHRIIFTGKQTGKVLVELFSNAALFVQPSESEGLSIALLEALSYGLPVIASNIPENLEVMQQIGMSFENKNVKDLAEQLQAFFLRNSNSNLIKEQSQEHVKQFYNWDSIVQLTASTYRYL